MVTWSFILVHVLLRHCIHWDHGKCKVYINQLNKSILFCFFCSEWHQYDDICMKENRGFASKLRSLFTDRYSDICKGKLAAGEVMLSTIFSILTSYDHINLSNFFLQLGQFYLVYKDPLLFGNYNISWTSLGFGEKQVTLYSSDLFCKKFAISKYLF